MPLVSMASAKNKIDGSIKKQVLDFLQKLQTDDTLPGLHIEPMQDPRDRRARTGRVNDAWRAVLFRIGVGQEPHYVYLGTWHHDEAIKIARSTVLKLNLALGAPEFEDRGLPEEPAPAPSHPDRPADAPVPQEQVEVEAEQFSDRAVVTGPAVIVSWVNQLATNWTEDALAEKVGLSHPNARTALEARVPAELNALIDQLPEAQGLVVLGLANGEDLEAVREELGLQPREGVAEDDEAELERALRESRRGVVFVGQNSKELRDAFESLDIDRWRVFLHPQQQHYVDRPWKGSYKISGGAGTGKTVVLLHRARALARRTPEARILLTTFTRTLAGSLQQQLRKLDPDLAQVEMGQAGVAILGMDKIASQVIRSASADEVLQARSAVLGSENNTLERRVAQTRQAFMEAVDRSDPNLPTNVTEPAFLEQEYISVVLANKVVDEQGYLRASRKGRGTALNRSARKELWKVFAQFRRSLQMQDAVTFPELAAVAAAVLNARAERGETLPFDHVLVDEAQDFHAAHWMLLRALVPEGPDDLFIAEDSHQRIYGQKVALSRFGIQIRGRSRKLRLNYRTTAENLAYAISLLEGAEFKDILDEDESTKDYRSVRSGPVPVLINAPDSAAEGEAVAETIARWIQQEGVAPEAVAVLVRSESQMKMAAEVLSTAKLPHGISKGGEGAGRDKVSVLTMHSAKGMEFERVVVMGVSSGEIPARWSFGRLPEAEQQDAQLRERSLLYVAVTRARDELVLTWSGEPAEYL